MQELELAREFDVAICMFSAIDYLLTDNDLHTALLHIRKHLNENSLFIFDFWNGVKVITSYSPYRVKIMKDESKKVIRISTTELKAVQHLSEITFTCIVIEENVVINEFEEKHVVRFFFPREIKHYLEEDGFEVLHMCPFLYVDRRINEETWNITVVAARR